MKIRELLPPYLYSMQYGDDDELDEYGRLLDVWTDADAVARFFESHSREMDTLFWGDVVEPEIAAVRTPVKAYGTKDPSLLRLYAIKMSSNCYLITGGGIKYCKAMQESPELMAEIEKLKCVLSFLKHLGIEDGEDIVNYVEHEC